MTAFRFPDGVELEGSDEDGNPILRMAIPLDEHNFLGRQCPSCQQVYRIAMEDYDALTDDVRLWCVYCGHNDDGSEFMTEQQRARLVRVAGDYGVQMVHQVLDGTFGRHGRHSRESAVSITYRSKPFFPAPLPGIDEEQLVRERSCAGCGLRYGIFGEHRFCPVCGVLPPIVAALDALSAETTRLDALGSLPHDVRASLREQGVLDRTYVDTIENLVAIVEALAEKTFKSAVPGGAALLRGKGTVFQRLDDFADLYTAHLLRDPRKALGGDWGALRGAWAARHLFTHADGIVDNKYLAAILDSPLNAGQRLRLTEAEVTKVIGVTERLCRWLAEAA